MGGLYEALLGPDPVPGRVHLTDAQIDDIRFLYTECHRRQVDIANDFGISQSFVSRIVNGKRRSSHGTRE